MAFQESLLMRLSSYGHKIKDATCPFVKKIHNIVSKQDERHIIIVGNPEHPEVQGIIGWCKIIIL